MSALTADSANPLLCLLDSGRLTRDDLTPSKSGAVTGARASTVFRVSRAERGAVASLFDLIEARALLGLPASSWALTPDTPEPRKAAPDRRRRPRGPRSPSVLRRDAARSAAHHAARSTSLLPA